MIAVKTEWKTAAAAALNALIKEKGIKADSVKQEELIIEAPPKPEMGDLAFPMFPFAKILRIAPQEIARSVAQLMEENETVRGLGEVLTAGPYVNVRLDIAGIGAQVLAAVERQGERYGHTRAFKGSKVMIEFSCPNTNKPLHLGHLRNDALGYAVARILEANGAEVRRVNLINDRGIHICKSMAAYKLFGDGKTPKSEGIKGDHFVGHYYVKYNEWSREDETAEDRGSGDPAKMGGGGTGSTQAVEADELLGVGWHLGNL